MSEKIRVRIDKCSRPSDSWYNMNIGQEFDVMNCVVNKDSYMIISPESSYLSYRILKSDCTIIDSEEIEDEGGLGLLDAVMHFREDRPIDSYKEVVKLPVKMIPNSNIFEDADGDCGSVTFDRLTYNQLIKLNEKVVEALNQSAPKVTVDMLLLNALRHLDDEGRKMLVERLSSYGNPTPKVDEFAEGYKKVIVQPNNSNPSS